MVSKILQCTIVAGLFLLGVAGCEKELVTITFDANGGTFDKTKASAAGFTIVKTDTRIVSLQIEASQKATVIKTPVGDVLIAPGSKKLKEWRNDKTKGKAVRPGEAFTPWDTFAVKGTETKLTLYAIWEDEGLATTERKAVTVTFDANGGTFQDGVKTTIVVQPGHTGTTLVRDDFKTKPVSTDPVLRVYFYKWSNSDGFKGKVKGDGEDFSPWDDFDVKDTETTLTLYAIWEEE